ncbi:DUF2892 domain-containing protein [uncultured Cohaesibacter sp.]|uniref:YgaP family membrane protein n=1 Tax=uncultured Cohaesibacter sp. TaxID=1002546 RepID=UPI0029C78E1E|nr:DUF2892 domain-containing protein [uncultured Cohaesibacter sp.]
MTVNVGKLDRVIRVIVGVVLLAIVFIGPQTLWGLLGIIPLATGLFRFCPLYTLIGFNSCPASEKTDA